MTIEIRGEENIHGKRIKLTRGGKEVGGIMIAQDMKNTSENFIFRWEDDNGKTCISQIGSDELGEIKAALAKAKETSEKEDEKKKE